MLNRVLEIKRKIKERKTPSKNFFISIIKEGFKGKYGRLLRQRKEKESALCK